MSAALKLIKGEGPEPVKWSHGKMLPKAPGSTNRVLAGGGRKPFMMELDLYVNPQPEEVKP